MTSLDRCVDRALRSLSEFDRRGFATDPAGLLRNLGLAVRAVDQLAQKRDDGGACDGVSFLEDGVILYARTPFSRRENFTLAHELGHWLVDQVPELYDWLADQVDPGRMLETLCDRVAQRLLLPAETVNTVVGEDPIRSRHVLKLFEASEASVPVCAIALASRLRRLGAVVIVNRLDEQVQYASVRPDPEQGWPAVFPWPGQPVPAGHPFQRLRDGQVMTEKSFWRMPWNSHDDYYIDAIAIDKRIIAVFSEIDIWNAERLHLDQPRDFDRRPLLEMHCCGRTRTVRGYPCPTCRHGFCPNCGKCRCDRSSQRERPCAQCSLHFQPHLLVNDLCEECRS